MKKKIIITYCEQTNKDNFSATEKLLFKEAKQAALKAYAPYSNFKVGVAVLLDNGKIFSGNNQENASYPIGICAEQTTLAYVHANFPNIMINTLVITAYHQKKFVPVSLCGKCRQVVFEIEEKFNALIKIILFGDNKLLTFTSIKDLLPLSFSSKSIGDRKSTRLNSSH